MTKVSRGRPAERARLRTIDRLVLLFASATAALVTISCGDTTQNPPSQLNLDRPMDIAFACHGPIRVTGGRTTAELADPIEQSAQPIAACNIRSSIPTEADPVPLPPGQEDLTSQGGIAIGPSFWYGFILQQGPGTVALARFDTRPTTEPDLNVQVLDADRFTPGKNSISIGEDPVAIATDASGCKVVTANAGSCDLSVMDVASAVDSELEGTPIDVRRLDVRNAAGELIRSKPAAMVAEPSVEVYGNRCGPTASGIMYIAYPSCHLVAAVDVASGMIVDGITFDAAGVPTILGTGNISCPDECGGGGIITAGTRPVTIDLEKDPRSGERRMVIGADNSSSIAIIELSDVTTRPESVAQIALENTTGTLGVTQIVMTPEIGMGGQAGVVNDDTAVGGQFQFAYAITTEDTIRVADILTLRKECDTQVDPRFLRDIRSVKDLSCLPVGDPLTPARRAGAKGPGIEFIADSIPLSIDIVKSVQIDDQFVQGTPTNLIGYFGIVGTSNGFTFIINVDDDDNRDLFEPTRPILVPMPLAIAHQLRDAIPIRGELAVELDDTVDPPLSKTRCDLAGPGDGTIVLGGPRATTVPARNIPLAAVAGEKATTLPGIRQVECVSTEFGAVPVSELSFSAPEAVRDLVFPDLKGLRGEELWTLTWEGPISQDLIQTDVDGPQVRESQIVSDDTGMRIVDQSRPFCDSGVELFDIVQVRGCDPAFGNADCPLGYRCFIHPNSQVQGIGACMLEDEADRLADACKDFLTSARRYTVGATESGKLQLFPRRHTLRTTPLEGCTDNLQCDALADVAAKSSNPTHPIDDTTVDERTWTCQADSTRAPVPTGKRCQLRCDASEDCVIGTICQGGVAGSGAKAGFCMESVVPPQACINAPQRYEMRVGEAFSVVGERTGFEHQTIADATGNCVKSPTANPLLTSRIPLVAPACDPTADPLSGKLPGGGFEPNPCSTIVENTEIAPIYNEGTCTLAAVPSELKKRQAPAIKYRNRGMTLTIVDPFYTGDQTCILDRKGTNGNIPQVVTGYQLAFRQTAGFSPLVITTIAPSLPVKVVRGPTDSIWVIDQGDFLSTSIAQPSTRGKVFRIDPHRLGGPSVLE